MFKNIMANYVSRIWGLVSVFVFVPFYIKILGIEAYAVISFYTVILTIMYFADGGLSATLNREIARSTDKQYLGNMLFTIEKVYLVICVFVSGLIYLTSKQIAANWLKSDSIPIDDLALYITLMGLSVSFQLFTTLENSGLMGLEKQVLSNTIQVSSSVLRSAIVLIPLYFSPTLLTFFIWQVCVNCIFLFITRYNLWRFVKENRVYKFDVAILKTVGRFAAGMMVMAIIASLNTQIDKILISKMLSLKEFGYYSLAGILSQAPVIIITPIALAILPRLVKFSELEENIKLKKLFHQNSVIISSLALSVALVLFLFTKDFITIWTHDSNIAFIINNVTKVLLLGSVFLSFQYMPYHLAIANGHTKTNVRLGIIVVVIIIPVLIIFISKFGLIGASIPWLIMNLFAYLFLGFVLINKFLINEFKRWLVYDTLIPLTITLLIGIVSYYLTLPLAKGYFVLLYSVVIGTICLSLNLLVYNRLNALYKIKIKEIINNE
jgi:O-antigen/teichoic acid export membrane protein